MFKKLRTVIYHVTDLQAAKEWDIDLANSRFIGDKESDMEAGRAAGVGKCILTQS